MPISPRPKALLFDVFGTVAEWRVTVPQCLSKLAEAVGNPEVKHDHVDWQTFAKRWRASYSEFTRTYDPNRYEHFVTVDEHHESSLRSALAEHNLLDSWTEEMVQGCAKIWHYLPGHKDSSAGISDLKERGYQVCTLSNGGPELLSDMARHSNFKWSSIVSAEEFGMYKPRLEVYLGACSRLGLKPEECAMVAAHLRDLKAAKKCGLWTIYVEREGEDDESDIQTYREKGHEYVDVCVGLEDTKYGGGLLEIGEKLEG